MTEGERGRETGGEREREGPQPVMFPQGGRTKGWREGGREGRKEGKGDEEGQSGRRKFIPTATIILSHGALVLFP